jgi:hypothetical protein
LFPFATEDKRHFSFAEPRGRFDKSVQYCLQIKRRAANDLEHFRCRGQLLSRLIRFAGENAYLLLQVGKGSGRYFASLGPIRAPTLDRLFASITMPHFAPSEGYDEERS